METVQYSGLECSLRGCLVSIPALPWIHFVTLGKSLTILCLSFLICKMGSVIVQTLESYCED